MNGCTQQSYAQRLIDQRRFPLEIVHCVGNEAVDAIDTLVVEDTGEQQDNFFPFRFIQVIVGPQDASLFVFESLKKSLQETAPMAKRRRPKRETRHRRIQRLMREGSCGLLPYDFSCPCPKKNGPEEPHPDHPGRVGFLTCSGCTYNAGLRFTNCVCTHPHASQVAARWLADAIKAWRAQQSTPTQLTLF